MKNLNDIDDFELKNSTQSDDINTLYQKYREFKRALKQIPLKTLQHNNWLSNYEDTYAISALFNNALTTNNALFRKNHTANDALTSLWLAKVMTRAKENSFQSLYSADRLTKVTLKEIAQLSPQISNIKVLPDLLAELGIILIYEESIPSLKLDGSAFLLPNGTPVIALSFRHARVDNFWFTLKHELAHVVLHYDLLTTPIIDDLENPDHSATDIEIQANRLAKESFITRAQWRNCPAKSSTNKDVLIKFASKLNIHPAILAGLLRKDRNKYDIYSDG